MLSSAGESYCIRRQNTSPRLNYRDQIRTLHFLPFLPPLAVVSVCIKPCRRRAARPRRRVMAQSMAFSTLWESARKFTNAGISYRKFLSVWWTTKLTASNVNPLNHCPVDHVRLGYRTSIHPFSRGAEISQNPRLYRNVLPL